MNDAPAMKRCLEAMGELYMKRARTSSCVSLSDAAGQANLDRAVEMYNLSATLPSSLPAPQDRAVPTSQDGPHAQSSFADGTESSGVSCPDPRKPEVRKEEEGKEGRRKEEEG
eukprot:767895-Hanusia_phi.AAC.1